MACRHFSQQKEANSRMKIELGGDWMVYAKALPQGWRALGVVDAGKDGEADQGALVVDPRQTYFQLNGMLIRSLDQASVNRMMRRMAA
jgi:hypothetical protein